MLAKICSAIKNVDKWEICFAANSDKPKTDNSDPFTESESHRES